MRDELKVTLTHALLAIMCEFDSPWPKRIIERGGLTFRLALRSLRWRILMTLTA